MYQTEVLVYFYTDLSHHHKLLVIVLSWLYIVLKQMPVHLWGNVILVYDNMCHLDGLRAAARLLPLPKPQAKFWIDFTMEITLIIIARKSIIQKTSFQRMTTPWQQNRHLSGQVSLRKQSVPCQKFTIFFSCIVWLNDVTLILHFVISPQRSQFCLRLRKV